MAALAAVYGAVFGLLPIGWIILNVIFLYQLAKDFRRVSGLAAFDQQDRLQLLFIPGSVTWRT